VWNQTDIGACVGNAAAGWLVTDKAEKQGIVTVPGGWNVNERYAVGIYGQATKIDRIRGVYPPHDEGTTGLAGAKVLKTRGLASSYRHAFGLRATLTALQSGPVMLGVSWQTRMFEPTDSHQLIPTGGLAGGHEVLVDEIDVENERVWMTNSWGEDWGRSGRAWLTWTDLGILLEDNGDVIQPIP
jgi:hypothetical protein